MQKALRHGAPQQTFTCTRTAFVIPSHGSVIKLHTKSLTFLLRSGVRCVVTAHSSLLDSDAPSSRNLDYNWRQRAWGRMVLDVAAARTDDNLSSSLAPLMQEISLLESCTEYNDSSTCTRSASSLSDMLLAWKRLEHAATFSSHHNHTEWLDSHAERRRRPVPDVQNAAACSCSLAKHTSGTRFKDHHLNALMVHLFHSISINSSWCGLPSVSLCR